MISVCSFRRLAAVSSVAAPIAVPGAAVAQWEPTEQITLISQSSPGTGNDLLPRELAKIWTEN